MSAYYGSENLDVKMQNLAKLESHQRLYYIAKCVGGNWVVMNPRRGGVFLLGTIKLLCPVVKLVVTLLQLSYRAACSNTQHCLKLPSYYSTSFITVPNLTNLTVRTDIRLLTVTVWCRESGLSDEDYLTLVRVHILMWARGVAVGCRTALRVRFPKASLEFYVALILQAPLWPVVD